MSGQCPQSLPRSSANAGEGQRKLNVRLTCGFTLTSRPERTWCEPRCEDDTALITQRSQVQTLPPLSTAEVGPGDLFTDDPEVNGAGVAFLAISIRLHSPAAVKHFVSPYGVKALVRCRRCRPTGCWLR